MFLETGLIGGGFLLIAFRRMWREACYFERHGKRHLAVPVQTALLTAFIGNIGGEYFLSGIVLFGLFVVYAAVGSQKIPVRQKSLSQRRQLNNRR
jgi:hypothetical protein